MQNNHFAIKKMVLCAILLSVTLIIGIIERAIPFDFAVPGVKLGLSNVIILTAIYIFGFRESFILVILKCVLLAAITGNTAAFLYSISGSLISFFAMLCAVTLSKKDEDMSAVGVSVIGAVFHNIGQILMACFILKSVNVFYYLPLLLVSGVITGFLVGLIVKYTLPYIKKLQ